MPYLRILGQVLVSLLSALLTEAFLKRIIVMVLERVVSRTESDIDNKILEAAKEAWGLKAPEAKPE
jgi:hypothetical protein